jgi:hypothetical protein
MSPLSRDQIEQFIEEGFVRLDRAFPRELAEQGCEILWKETGCDPGKPATWTKPVVWLGDHAEEPFRQAANTPVLHAAFDQLVGAGRWEPRASLGTFPIRFPSAVDTGDTGWHVDASFPGDDADTNDYLSWRVNVHSRGRALLMLFLFSEVGEADAPTRIRAGSHLSVARLLAPAGEPGIRVRDLDLRATESCREVQATGEPGTVYLCHPFLAHAAQVHRGTRPRFMAQPPLILKEPLTWDSTGFDALPPVAEAIRRAGRVPGP